MGYAKRQGLGARLVCFTFWGVLITMMFMTTVAQAHWLVEGKNISANQVVLTSTHTEFNLRVEKETNLEILCSTIKSEDLLLLSSITEATGGVAATNCKAWQNSVNISANCKPIEPILITGKARPILHNAKNFILFEPEVLGGKFTVIKFKLPCALPESNNVKGSLVMECAKLESIFVVGVDCGQGEKVHLLKPNEALFTGDALVYGTKAARLSGVASAELLLGTSWAGHV